MIEKIFESGHPSPCPAPKEGELYRVVKTFGRTFELRYGYYGERDRENPLCDPSVIYPDFKSSPLHTDTGEPFVTMMQDACSAYKGEHKKTPDTTCADCDYLLRGEEWFGVCVCPKNKKSQNELDIQFKEKTV